MGKILLIDDDQNTLQVLSEKLRLAGHETIIAQGGREGVEKAKRELPQLIVTDVMMPDVSGYDVTRAIRESEDLKNIPIIMLTAHSRVEELARGLDQGADDYVVKPFKLRELLARVNALLRMRELQSKVMETERLKALLEMAGAAAHEINQPLTVIMGYADLIRGKMSRQDPHFEHIQSIYENASRINQIIKKLLAIRRYESKTYVGGVKILDVERSTTES